MTPSHLSLGIETVGGVISLIILKGFNISTKKSQVFTTYQDKNRRLAVEIEKKFECPYGKCYKFYGSDVSLNLHIKLKHNGGNKTDREKLAVSMFLFRSKSAWRN
jgi:hypothetical protein